MLLLCLKPASDSLYLSPGPEWLGSLIFLVPSSLITLLQLLLSLLCLVPAGLFSHCISSSLSLNHFSSVRLCRASLSVCIFNPSLVLYPGSCTIFSKENPIFCTTNAHYVTLFLSVNNLHMIEFFKILYLFFIFSFSIIWAPQWWLLFCWLIFFKHWGQYLTYPRQSVFLEWIN